MSQIRPVIGLYTNYVRQRLHRSHAVYTIVDYNVMGLHVSITPHPPPSENAAVKHIGLHKEVRKGQCWIISVNNMEYKM